MIIANSQGKKSYKPFKEICCDKRYKIDKSEQIGSKDKKNQIKLPNSWRIFDKSLLIHSHLQPKERRRTEEKKRLHHGIAIYWNIAKTRELISDHAKLAGEFNKINITSTRRISNTHTKNRQTTNEKKNESLTRKTNEV